MQRVADDGTASGPAAPVTAADVAALDSELDRSPRWLWAATDLAYRPLLAAGVRVRRGHDLGLAERILQGRAGHFPPIPVAATDEQPALFDPARPDGAGDPLAAAHDVVAGLGARWADQRRRAGPDPGLALLLAVESASALAAAEMSAAGLPWRADVHRRLLDEVLGPPGPAGARPVTLQALAERIDAAFGFGVNPDSAVDVRAAFRRVGFELETTRSWVLRQVDHPAVAPLLEYKERARLHTANGRAWLATWVRGGRFRSEFVVGGVVSGRWATRGGGALQVPRALRPAVIADHGHVLVVADAAQLEPRVLAAVSGDDRLAGLTAAPDMYAALAAEGFAGDRGRAKLALLGAMYGQTTGEAGRLVAVLRQRYPRAIAHLETAARAGERGAVVHSVLGRASPPPGDAWREVVAAGDERAARATRDRGRFTRNFVIQASAADWAAAWLSGARLRLFAVPGAELVFFQHDELVVHVPRELADAVVAALVESAVDAGRLVFGSSPVGFPVHPDVVRCYAEAG